MQRLLAHKLASSLLQNTATSSSSALLLHSVPYKTFSSVTKTLRLNQLLNTSPTHPFHRCIPLPWQSQYTLAGEIPWFLSIPVVASRFLTNFSNTHFRILSKSISDCRAWFLQRRPDFSRNFRYQNSGWYPLLLFSFSFSYRRLVAEKLWFEIIFCHFSQKRFLLQSFNFGDHSPFFF